MNEKTEWDELFDRHLHGELSDAEKERLAELLDSDVEARKSFVEVARWDAQLAEMLREGRASLDDPDAFLASVATGRGQHPSKNTLLRLLLAAAAVVIAVLTAGLLYQGAAVERRIAAINDVAHQPAADPSIAKITGLSGSLIWTGDRGRIVRELSAGTELSGGTIEGAAPDSWFELRFNDGSSVMIAGASMLTFSDLGQKELRLKEGRFSANVRPQPPGKPMLIHTRSALLKVLGTRFEVEAEVDSTSLHVSEGKVQMRRLSDGRTVDVPAKHRVVASAEGGMAPLPIPDAVHDWKSQLKLGPEDTYGKWLPETGGNPASLKAIPFVPQENQAITLYLLGLSVKRTDNSPVIVRPGSRFVVRGRLSTAADVYFGIGVAHTNGEFAGKFRARQPAANFVADSEFEAVFRLDEFGLDPCVWDRKDELPNKPDNLVVTCAWSFTHTGGPTGLEITEVELIPPLENKPL